MKIIANKVTERVQPELPQASFDRLKKLKDKTEAASYAEVIKNALRLYEALIAEAEAGNNVCIRHADGCETIYKPIF